MKHVYLLTDTAYKMLYQAPFLELMYTYVLEEMIKTKKKKKKKGFK